jgi:predicted metal-dependent peptidase
MIKTLEEALNDSAIRQKMNSIDPEKEIVKTRTQFIFKSAFFTSLVLKLGVVPTKSIRTMATDGENYYYNPEYVQVDAALDRGYLYGDLLHETLHIGIGHPWMNRKRDKNQTLFNIAADLIVDSRILKSGFKIPPWSVIYYIDPFKGEQYDEPMSESKVNELVEQYVNMNTIQVYELLTKNLPKDIQQQLQDQLQSEYENGNGQGQGGEGESNQQQNAQSDSDNSGNKRGKKKAKAEQGANGNQKDNSEGKNGNQQDGSNSQNQGPNGSKSRNGTGIHTHSLWEQIKNNPELKEKWRQAFMEALMGAKMRGDIPAGFKRDFDALSGNKMPWRNILYQFIVQKPADYNIPPYNKKTIPYDIITPVLQMPSLEDIIIAIDTSGSITEQDLTDFMSEVNAILTSYPNSRGILATCDAAVHEFQEFEGPIDVRKIELHGGGGTDFRPLFARIEKEGIVPKVMVFFTDGDATYPSVPPNYPVLFVIKNSNKKEAPFGMSVFYGDEDEE